jgi:hypothetical protein
MENQTELKWYQKPTGIIILLIVFFPVGLFLMWKNEMWSKKTRWIVTGTIAILFIANAGGKNSGLDDSSFYKKDFRSNTATIFGESGYNRAIFEENGNVEYCNMWKEAKNKNGSFHPSNLTKGTWKFIDSEKKKIQVDFSDGNNRDKAGIWEFDKNYKSVKLTNGKVLSR